MVVTLHAFGFYMPVIQAHTILVTNRSSFNTFLYLFLEIETGHEVLDPKLSPLEYWKGPLVFDAGNALRAMLTYSDLHHARSILWYPDSR